MKKKPNIVVILADDLGIGDIQATSGGYGKIPTPHMDSCANNGRVFSDAHSNSAVCTPTRYGVLTGRYCFRTKLKKGVLYGYGAPLIEESRPTMASVLKKSGYRTACIGKWHLGLGWNHIDGSGPDKDDSYDPSLIDWNEPLTSGPHTLGFDNSFIISASLDMPPYTYIENGKLTEEPTCISSDSPRPAFARGGAQAPGFDNSTTLREFTRYTESFIAQQAGSENPFFLYFATTSPHTPHVPLNPFVGKSGMGPYGDMVCEHDWSVGRIIAALDRHGLTDDTLVIITSDNGCHASPLGLEEKRHFANGKFRGQKSDAWDGGHRVPFIAIWPPIIPAGTVCDETICLTDLFATFAGLAGDPLPGGCSEDGMDIFNLFSNTGAVERPPVVHHSIDGSFAVRKGKWKYIACPGSGGWSLPNDSVPPSAPQEQLYNMEIDPEETVNCYRENREVLLDMRRVLEYFRKGENVPLPE